MLMLLQQTWDIPVVAQWLTSVVGREVTAVDWHDEDLLLRTAQGSKILHDGLAIKLLDRPDPTTTIPVIWSLLTTLDHHDESHEILARVAFRNKIPGLRFLWFPGSFRTVASTGAVVKSCAIVKPLDKHNVAIKIPFTGTLHRHLKAALLYRLYGVTETIG